MGGKLIPHIKGGKKKKKLTYYQKYIFYQFITDNAYKTLCPDIYFLYFIPNGKFW